jgi:hypothetical protein
MHWQQNVPVLTSHSISTLLHFVFCQWRESENLQRLQGYLGAGNHHKQQIPCSQQAVAMCFVSEGIVGTRPCRHVQRQSLDKNKTFIPKKEFPKKHASSIHPAWHKTHTLYKLTHQSRRGDLAKRFSSPWSNELTVASVSTPSGRYWHRYCLSSSVRHVLHVCSSKKAITHHVSQLGAHTDTHTGLNGIWKTFHWKKSMLNCLPAGSETFHREKVWGTVLWPSYTSQWKASWSHSEKKWFPILDRTKWNETRAQRHTRSTTSKESMDLRSLSWASSSGTTNVSTRPVRLL